MVLGATVLEYCGYYDGLCLCVIVHCIDVDAYCVEVLGVMQRVSVIWRVGLWPVSLIPDHPFTSST